MRQDLESPARCNDCRQLRSQIGQNFIRSVIECYNQNNPCWELTFGIKHYRNDVELGIDGC